MNYRHVYMLIIEHAKSEMKNGLRPKSQAERRRKFINQSFEFHHVLPKSLFPNWVKRKSNLVCLTAREGYVALLATQVFTVAEVGTGIGDFTQESHGSLDRG